MASPLVATGRDDAAVAERREWARGLLGFLYSTPAYWHSLELHGWGRRGQVLREHTRAGRWEEMAAVVDDEMLSAFVPVASHAHVAALLTEWYGGLCGALTFPLPEDAADEPAVAEVVARLQA